MKEARLVLVVRLGQEGFAWVSGKYLKNLKRGGTEGRGHKDFKKGGGVKLSEGVGLYLSASKSPHFYGMLCAAGASKQHQPND